MATEIGIQPSVMDVGRFSMLHGLDGVAIVHTQGEARIVDSRFDRGSDLLLSDGTTVVGCIFLGGSRVSGGELRNCLLLPGARLNGQVQARTKVVS